MKLVPTRIPEVVIVEPTVFSDARGWFMETYHEEKFRQGLAQLGLPAPQAFVQDNHSNSARGVLRGLHYQKQPRAQGKLVRVVRGAAWDVAVDIRRRSATFGQWVGVELSAHNHRQLWIPPGFAHGFLSLEDDTEFLYKTTDLYDKASERAIRWNDPDLRIEWPTGVGAPRVNEKDQQAVAWSAADLED